MNRIKFNFTPLLDLGKSTSGIRRTPGGGLVDFRARVMGTRLQPSPAARRAAATLLAFAALIVPLLKAEPVTVPPPSGVDPMVEALPVLQSRYPDFAALNYKPGDKLEDIIARSNGEISLIAPDSLAPTPIITAALPDGVIYWRLASFTPKKDWADLGTDLQTSVQHGGTNGAILDLRSNDTPQDMRGASQVISYFAPRDSTLKRYNLKEVDRSLLPADVVLDSAFSEPLIVLVNQKTTGAAEVLAACLKADGALVVGAQTPGRGADFADVKLSSGLLLRFVTDHVRLASGLDLWDHPVVPDLTPGDPDHNEKAALTLIRDNHILDVIQESDPRHRLSEATLVLGQDPEWDDYLGTLERKPVLLSLPVIHDPVLVSALDSLKAIRLSQRTLPPPGSITAELPTSSSVQ